MTRPTAKSWFPTLHVSSAPLILMCTRFLGPKKPQKGCALDSHKYVVQIIFFYLLQDFFIDFSRHGPCILSRSVLQLLYLPQCNKVFGTLNFVDVLRDAAKNFIFPPALMPKSTLLNSAQVK